MAGNDLAVLHHGLFHDAANGEDARVRRVDDGEEVKAGTIMVKIPRDSGKTRDITGGLPRVTELFEARSPSDPSRVAEIDGTVEIGKISRGSREVRIISKDASKVIDYKIPIGKHILVRHGDFVKSGEPLTGGAFDPVDILKIKGVAEVQGYLVNEIQEVYRIQGVKINDKHIEIIVRQMLRKVKVTDQGDSNFVIEQIVDKFDFIEENDRVLREGGKPATAVPVLMGITKAALNTESFISAASFQETTKVLTEAALAGRTDYLVGLKENVILGHLIPAGTGFKSIHESEVRIQPSALEALASEKERVLERSFPLLESALRTGGDGAGPTVSDGNGERSAPRPAAPTGLDALLGGGIPGPAGDDDLGDE